MSARYACALTLALVPLAAGGWEPVLAEHVSAPKKHAFTVQLPPGWLVDVGKQALMASRDGPSLGAIGVELFAHKDAFRGAKKQSRDGEPPEDLAEAYLAEVQSSGVLNVEVVSKGPVQLAGRPAFRLQVRYRSPAEFGVEFEEVALGTTAPEGFLVARYRAPRVHFFEKNLPDFEAVLPSLALTPAASK